MKYTVILLITLSIIGVSCAQKKRQSSRQAATESLKAVTKIEGPNGVKGTIFFECLPNKAQVRVFGEISGLSPGAHGFHIHQFGDQTDGCKSMAGHFNPGKHEHGSPQDGKRHVGDLGNIEADRRGVARIDLIDSVIALKGPDSIVGRGVVVHEKEDDLGRGGAADSKKTGNAGGRVGCGVVALTKSN